MAKIYFISLGCDKNLVDSEIMLGLLHNSGYQITDDLNKATYAVVNSCCFIGDAKEESINTIIELGELKTTGKLEGIIVTGCLAQRYHDLITEELPEVDAVIGTTAYDSIIDAVDILEKKRKVNNSKNKRIYIQDLNRLAGCEEHRVAPMGEISSYIKIAEGCDKRCTYCIIPYVRGNYRSLPIEVIVKEAENLANQGTRELILVAQETTLYGTDIYGKKALPNLVKKLSAIERIEWIRLLYCYPEEITDEIIEIFTIKKVCPYIDMPIQHSSDAILKRMGRRTNRLELVDKINKLRKRVPDIALRTTLITGFPGETEEDFEALYDFVKEIRFDRLGVFPYSREEGTPASLMENQVEDDIKIARKNKIMELQQSISAEKAAQKIGKTYKVFVEGVITGDYANTSLLNIAENTGKKVYVGRTYMDAPDVDGQVFFESFYDIISGDFVDVKIISSDEYDLFGELV